MKNADMPAMPKEDIYLGFDEVECRELSAASRGLTKREQFAAIAMQGLLANSEINRDEGYETDSVRDVILNTGIASSAVWYADQLLRELEK